MTIIKRVFMVDEKPFFPLGGQSHTSSAYNDSESETAFKAVKLLHGNTLVTDVYWEHIEPEEGKFDFTMVDELLASARQYGLKLILMWFATWKNANMDYTPDWVKTDPKRFKRVTSRNGKDLWTLSSYCKANFEADKKAFITLCNHLKAKDGTEHTVIGLQVENEPSLPGSDRDYGSEAQTVFDGPVPAKLMSAMKENGKGQVYNLWQLAGGKQSGTWSEIFGWPAGEFMTTWSIATYIDGVAEAGKAVYDIPMYINHWFGMLNRGPVPEEIYQGGGAPVGPLLDIYKWATPHLDLIAPDIYELDSKNYEAACATYAREDNPLFVPESIPGGTNIWHMFRAIADYNAIGYFIFGAEDIVAGDGSVRPESQALVESFRSTAAVIPLLLKYQGTGKIHAVVQEDYLFDQWFLGLDGYLGRVQFGFGNQPNDGKDWRHPSSLSGGPRQHQTDLNRGRGLVTQKSRNEFYLVGANYRFFLRPKLAPNEIKDEGTTFDSWPGNLAYQLKVDEGHFNQDGEFIVDRRRNGDAISNGVWVEADTGVVRVITCD